MVFAGLYAVMAAIMLVTGAAPAAAFGTPTAVHGQEAGICRKWAAAVGYRPATAASTADLIPCSASARPSSTCAPSTRSVCSSTESRE